MNIGTALTSFIAGAALAAMLLPGSPELLAQSAERPDIVPSPLPEPVVLHRTSTDAPKVKDVPRNLLSAVPTQQYSHGNPSAEEQYILELINRARANPAAEGKMLAELDDPAINSAYTFFGVDRNKLKTDFAGYPSRPPLAFNEKLLSSSELHSKDMHDNNFQGHTGSNGSQLQDRLGDAGYTGWTSAGENVAAQAQSLIYGHAGFNVDWGVASLGHRKNIMNYDTEEIFTEIGIGVVHKNPPASQSGPIIITENFGNAKSPYIVGVVYRDLNDNDFYDVGEGIPGVTITPSSGTYFAITSESGGYAIPITSNGSVTVTASGGALTAPITRNIALGTENVKLDFTPDLPSAPGAITLAFPTNAAIVPADSVRFRWNALAGVTGYRLQVATDSNFTALVLNDSTLSDTSAVLRSLQNKRTYYWRVAGKNTAGWGVYGGRNSFRVLLPPAPVTLVAPAQGGTISTSNAMFTWRRGDAAETAYWFELASDAAMNTIVVRDTMVSDTFKVVNGLQAGTTYYWRVRARNEAGLGAYSAQQSVLTSTSGVEREASAGAFRLATMPNPFTGEARISFRLEKSADVTVTVLNSIGEEIATIASGLMEADEHELTWNAGPLANGVYFCQVRAGDVVSTRKMVLAR